MGWRDRFRPADDADAIDMGEALGWLAKGAVLVDVRSRGEYVRGHAPGAKLVDLKQLRRIGADAVFGDDPLANRDATLIVLATLPGQASLAAAALKDAGLAAHVLRGGLAAWVRDGQTLIPGEPR